MVSAEEYHEVATRLRARATDPRWADAQIGWPLGWTKLIDRLDQQLSETVPEYKITQVKAKFGTLRFYTDIPSTYTSENRLIQMAEAKSELLCTECGARATTQHLGPGWLVTLCETHFLEAQREKAERWRANNG